MAIKGKTKTRSKRPQARAPRREPVPVPKPVYSRRWVQLTAAFLLGIGVLLFAGWVRGNLRDDRARDKAARELAAQRQVVQEWKGIVEGQVSTVGQIQTGSLQPPAVASGVTAALSALSQGKDKGVTADALAKTRKALKAAADQIETFTLSEAISGKGFEGGPAEFLLTSQTELAGALHAYEDAARLAQLALAADKETRTDIAVAAQSVAGRAAGLLQTGWNQYQNALASVQLTAPVGPGAASAGSTG
jgi:hypothetical protein